MPRRQRCPISIRKIREEAMNAWMGRFAKSALLIGFAAVALCGPAAAQSYPSKEVRLIVPFPPGGVTDLNARILAKHLSKFWGQPVTSSTMPGGGGTTGTMFVLNAAKDGYTMMLSATGQATQIPAIDSKLPY